MNQEQEFDDLARRKLEEREHPFSEAHWQLVHEQLGARRRPAGGWYWSAAVVGLLLLGGGIWMLNGPEEASLGLNSLDQRTISMQEKPMDGTGTSARNETGTIMPHDGDVSPIAGEVMTTSTAEASDQVDTHGPEDGSITQHVAGAAPSLRPRPSVASAPAPDRIPVNSDILPDGKDGVLPSTGGFDTQGSGTVPSGNAMSMSVGALIGSGTTGEVGLNAAAPTATGASEAGSARPAGSAIDPAIKTSTTAGSEVLVTAASTPLDSNSTPNGAATVPAQLSDSAAGDPLVTAPAPIVPHYAPWEVGIVAGAFNSYSRYVGGSSDDWSDDVEPLWSPSVGAEVMHLGRNVGLGIGLHYGTYAERITTEAVDRTSLVYDPYWYLNPVDTTILHITDTVQQGGETYYVGQSVNTTVLVLTQGTDTLTTTIRARDARTMTNRVSYLEIPLLLDAHLVQGRWSMGLRGGPSLGLLMGRQGELPNDANDGYVALPDVPFRELVVGYTARAYVRYRFNAAWSVGIEPAVRGQLMNSLGEGTLERRTMSYGGVVSLSYRLP